MPKASFRFYAELNDGLPEERKSREFQEWFDPGATLGQELLGFGIPPKDVDLVLVNGNSVDFDHVIQEGDRFSVYPVFERFNIEGVTSLRRTPLRRIRFIADTDLPELAFRMRMRGFDVHFDKELSPHQIVEKSLQERRIILTRNKELLESEGVTRGLLVAEQCSEYQAERIVHELALDS